MHVVRQNVVQLPDTVRQIEVCELPVVRHFQESVEVLSKFEDLKSLGTSRFANNCD